MSITASRRSTAKVETATAGKMGPWQATALVVGSIVGVGIFSLPYSLASYGPISLVAMAIASVGAIALAMVFAGLSRRLPASGGPYAYARTAFGNTWGFANAWSYWITAWAGNAAIAVGWVYYVEHFVNKGGNTTASIFIVLAGLWIPAAVNLTGVRNLSAFQVVTTVFKFVPLIFMATVGLFFISTANFTPWNTSGDTTSSALGGAAAICLFSFLGVEVAAVAASKVRNPEHNVPRATLGGTLASAAVYMLSLVAVFGILPATALAQDSNKASYASAANEIFGGAWSGNLVAALVIISGIGALNGWTMICAEMPLAAAKDGLFPKVFGARVVARHALGRDHRLDRAGLGRRRHQLLGHQRRHRLHDPGPDDRDHRGRPVRVLRARPADLAVPGRSRHQQRPPGPRRVRRGGRVRVVDRVHLLQPHHLGDRVVRVLGSVPDDRRCVRAGHPRLPGAAQAHDRAGRRAVVQVRSETMFGVNSEVGRLREVIVHRPGTELSRLTPDNVDSLLFDDVMWAERARDEHDLFAKQLVDHGVTVHHFADLLAEALDADGARDFVAEPAGHARAVRPDAGRSRSASWCAPTRRPRWPTSSSAG